MKPTLLLPVMLLCLIPRTFSQIETDFREIFLEAESEFLFEEYAEALPDYENLIRQYPENDNLNYKIGVCLLNNPYRKQESISYLEKAVRNVNPKYKENSFREVKAPLEAFFYLGNAYRINNQLEKAIETYQLFKDQADPDLYDLDLVDEQVQACRNAQELQLRPIDINIRNMGDIVNTRFTESNFVVSGDETALIYIQKLAFYDAPFYAEKINGQWSYPRNLIASGELGPGVDEDVYPVALSYNGDEMIIYRSDDFIGDLYASSCVDGSWTPIRKLNDNINTKYWESHACYTASGDTLYFTSNRKGTYGGLDIYYSVKGEGGEWGIPENLGPVINTRYNEETPAISADGNTLYFSSYGHHNMGGYDVFYSNRLENGEWSVPVNAGYPINTTDDDVFYMPVQNGHFAYYPRYLEDTYGNTDIYLLEVFSETHPRKFQVSGILGIEALGGLSKPVRIAVIGQFSRDTVAVAWADAITGAYEFEVSRGSYELLVEGDGIETTSSSFVIPEGYYEETLALEETIPLTKVAELTIPVIVDNILAEDSIIFVTSDESLPISLTLEAGALLYVSTYHDTMYFSTDSFRIDRPAFVYNYSPVPGDNFLKIKMIDTINRLSFKDIQVVYTPMAITEPLAGILPPEPVSEGTHQLRSDLLEQSSGALREVIGELDLAAEGITSEEELLIYLRDHAEQYNYDAQDVHDLIRKKMQVDYLEDYLAEMIRISDDESLRQALQDIDLNSEEIGTLQDLYETILNRTGRYGYEAEQVNELFSLLSQREELNELVSQLSESARGGIRDAIDNLDIEKEGIDDPVGFMSYLLEAYDRYGYSQTEAMGLLLDYIGKKDLGEALRILIANSSGDLQTLLITLDPEANDIRSLADLYAFLINQTASQDFTGTDVMRLFLILVKTFEDQPLVTEITVPETEQEVRVRTGGTWPFYVLGGMLLVIILFFATRRKKWDQGGE